MRTTSGLRRAPDGGGGGPASPDLWKRLARLDSRYETRLESVRESAPGAALRWRVTMRARDQAANAPAIVVVRDSAVEAIAQALDEAEAQAQGRRSWS